MRRHDRPRGVLFPGGFALLVTLLILVLLVVLILEFDRRTRMDLQAAGNFRDLSRSYYLAKSGVSVAEAVLREDAVQDQRAGSQAYDGPPSSASQELWSTPLPPYPVGEGTVSGEIQDECGKMSVNALVVAGGSDRNKDWDARIRRLFEVVEADPAVVAAVGDWIDKDDALADAFGAETDYYASRPRPYRARNGPVVSLPELRMIKGMDESSYAKVKPFLTTAACDGVPPAVNLNTAAPEVLQALDPGRQLDQALAVRITAGRPYKTVDQLKPIVGPEIFSRIDRFSTVRSRFFSVLARGEVNETRTTILALVERQSGPQPAIIIRSWRTE